MSWTKQSSSSSTTITESSRWSGKKWNVMGDSITQGYGTTEAYHQYVSQWLGISSVNNYGIGGTNLATGGSHPSTDSMWYRVQSMDTTADLITVFGGTNDYGNATQPQLGTITSTDNATIYGALHTISQTLISTYPNATYAFFTPLPRSDSYTASSGVITLGRGTNPQGYTLEQVAQAVIDVGKYYSIPVLDLYHGSDLYPWDSNFNTKYFGGAGLHPNAAGHEIIAYKISAFLNTL